MMKFKQRKDLFAFIYEREGGCCTYCGIRTRPLRRGLHRAPDRATLDHVLPRSQGGRLTRDNLVLACAACNNERGIMDAEAFRAIKAGGRG